MTLSNLLLPLAIFRETRAALRSDVDVGRRVRALFGQRAAVAGWSGEWKEQLALKEGVAPVQFYKREELIDLLGLLGFPLMVQYACRKV